AKRRVATEPPEPTEHPDEHLLRHVLGVRLPDAEGEREVVDARLVALDDLGERVAIAGGGASHERPIGISVHEATESGVCHWCASGGGPPGPSVFGPWGPIPPGPMGGKPEPAGSRKGGTNPL